MRDKDEGGREKKKEDNEGTEKQGTIMKTDEK